MSNTTLSFTRLTKISRLGIIAAGLGTLVQPALADDERREAGTRVIFQDSHYIYYRTPLWRMNLSKEGDIRKRAFTKIKAYLEANKATLADATKPGTDPDTEIDALNEFEKKTETYLLKLQDLLIRAPQFNVETATLRPSAYVVLLGAKIPRLSIGNDSSMQLAFVVVPVQYTFVDKVSGKMYVRNKVEWSPVLVNFYDVKRKGEKKGGLRIGGGLVWGPMDEPEDFIGALGNVSITASMPELSTKFKIPALKELNKKMRWNLKVGVLKQWDENQLFNKKMNPFAFLSIAPGEKMDLTSTLNIGHSVSVEAVASKLFRGPDDFYLEEQPTYYRSRWDRPTDWDGIDPKPPSDDLE